MEVKKLSSPSSSGSSVRKQPTAIARMKQDYLRLKRDPLPYITAEPLSSNILEWHYVVKGPEDTPYCGGYYHGTLLFPREFPFKPPSIYMLTPNGRFKTNTRLCLSISDFHPDTWNPTWCVSTILTGLLSFMLETTSTLGSIETTIYEKQYLAKKSLAFNLKNPQFVELFPDICEEIEKRLKMEKEQSAKTVNAITNGSIPKNSKINGKMRRFQDDQLDSDDEGIGDDIPEGINSESNLDNGALENGYLLKSATASHLSWQSNLIISVCFVIFALIVYFVFKSINQE